MREAGVRRVACGVWRAVSAARRGECVLPVPVQAVRGAGGAGAARPGRQSLGDRRAARVALRSIGAPLQRCALVYTRVLQSRTRLPHCPLHMLENDRVRLSFIPCQFFASLPREPRSRLGLYERVFE